MPEVNRPTRVSLKALPDASADPTIPDALAASAQCGCLVPSADSCSAANAACGLQDYNVAIGGQVACAPLDSSLGVLSENVTDKMIE